MEKAKRAFWLMISVIGLMVACFMAAAIYCFSQGKWTGFSFLLFFGIVDLVLMVRIIRRGY
ncbi:MAG: hypothetical protein JEZ07_19205 [Phycisphaerae bacterium]|nr:hypothetical protein [Phycisphaerae bacterium]